MRAYAALILALLPGPLSAQQARPPAGWRSVAAITSWSALAQCANRSTAAYDVALSADSTRLAFPRATERTEAFTAVNGGLIRASYGGEFGGRVVWQPTHGRAVVLSDENVRGLFHAGDRVFGLAGLAHLGLNYGSIVEFRRDTSGDWTVDTVGVLPAAPEAFTQLGGDTILVIGAGELYKVAFPSAVIPLAKNEVWKYLYPTSVLRDRAGVIYVGMRSAVARLVPNESGYQESWLRPANRLTQRCR